MNIQDDLTGKSEYFFLSNNHLGIQGLIQLFILGFKNSSLLTELSLKFIVLALR